MHGRCAHFSNPICKAVFSPLFVTCFYTLSHAFTCFLFFFLPGLIWQHEHVLSQGSSNSNTSKLTPTKMDTKRITTETTPSSNHTSPNQLSNSSKKNLFDKQHKDIDYLVKKVRYLEGKIFELEGCLFVTL